MSDSTITSNTDDWIDDAEVKAILQEHLDKKDYQIFKALNENGRISDTELGEKVGLSRTAARRRRSNLQNEGIIDVLAVIVLQEADLAYADVRVSFSAGTTQEEIDTFIDGLLDAELIYEISEYLGSDDILLRVWHASLYELKVYVSERLRGNEVVEEYDISPIVKTRKAWQKVINDGH
ncbi:Lrp/AsnC family transcriptional regulator [Halegenticoccus tardaugens]|uniref:Lrp/AsnC family transcriptional regulator n=1 Tax=Halegenticoccus tardaugens TaxID=2071624 RepID=UPI00100AECED|nr:Lrp/AsnC family transcriptional regulator [Halegenticoccus tardaugens]